MEKECCKSEIIRFVENSSDEENLIIAVFIAGMRAQKNINLLSSNMDGKNIVEQSAS